MAILIRLGEYIRWILIHVTCSLSATPRRPACQVQEGRQVSIRKNVGRNLETFYYFLITEYYYLSISQTIYMALPFPEQIKKSPILLHFLAWTPCSFQYFRSVHGSALHVPSQPLGYSWKLLQFQENLIFLLHQGLRIKAGRCRECGQKWSGWMRPLKMM